MIEKQVKDILDLHAEVRRLNDVNYALDRTAAAYKRERDQARTELAEARLALSNICAMQTQNCAYIGVKMAERARKALPVKCASSVRIGDGGSAIISPSNSVGAVG